ncbi:MAG: cytidylate kinase-like family protein [Syntrophales bacterium]|nr:cytidylate kinase-like family protein [Syntrophales bacterium]
MAMDKRLCVICAWRQYCQKRFSVTFDGISMHCPDFTRDYTIKDLEADRKALESQLEKWRREGKDKKYRPCITVSREAGAGASEICRKLAEELKMDLIGSQIIARIAESANMSEKVVSMLDEKKISMLDSWIQSFFTARHLWPDVYLQHLIKVIRAGAGEFGNAIIMGRGAQFILPAEKIFRVRFIAPLEKRIEHVMRNRGLSYDEAKAYIVKTDNDRSAFIMKYFHEDVTNPAHYDLVLNTGDISIDEAVKIVKEAYQAKKFLIP